MYSSAISYRVSCSGCRASPMPLAALFKYPVTMFQPMRPAVRIRYEIIASRRRLFSWRDGVVPIALEGIALNVEGSHFGIGDFDTFWIEALVDVASDGEAGLGGSGADQLNDDVVADERLAAPVLGDVGKEAMLDAVPFAGAGRQMGDGDF